MIENFRKFQAGPDPFGQTWDVEFRWIQNAITIRHADAVDVKFFLRSGDTMIEKVVALPHPQLVALAKESGDGITDPWCSKLAAMHLKYVIESGEDLEKTLIAPDPHELASYAKTLRFVHV